jgi:hypothetical protein
MKNKFYIKEELIRGEKYYIIYQRIFLFFGSFYERWNSEGFAEIRLKKLLK